jgi:hypothetical protein
MNIDIEMLISLVENRPVFFLKYDHPNLKFERIG